MNAEYKLLNSPRIHFDENKPFEGDLFNRKELADQVTGYLDRLRDGTVLAIDAQWGEGKSWFGRNWAASLKKQDYRVIYLDAFQQDYIEDPFLLIASEINGLFESNEELAEDLKGKAAKVMSAILPVGTKVLISISSRIALGSSDASKVIEDAIQSASDSTADATQKWIENKIDDHKIEKESLESFRSALHTYCESQEKPVVFFIDELDRCRPSFAVKLIERLKHFFDVPNLVFILLLNRVQLEKAIKGVYGADTEATSYLSKFIHMYLKLPKKVDSSGTHSNANWKYLWRLVDHYKIPKTEPLDHFIKNFSVFASIMNMSLRDLEKGMSLLVLNDIGNSAEYLAWPIALKLIHPNIFYGLINDSVSAHIEALELIQNMHASEDFYFWAKSYFIGLHATSANKLDLLSNEQIEEYKKLIPSGFFRSSPLKFWLKRLDIAIQD